MLEKLISHLTDFTRKLIDRKGTVLDILKEHEFLSVYHDLGTHILAVLSSCLGGGADASMPGLDCLNV